MQKYYKLSRKDHKLGQPPELKFIKLTSLALTTFLITFLSISILTPQQNSSASSDLLVSYQADAGTVSLRTSAAPVSLSLTSGSAGAMRTVSDDVYVTASAAGYQLYLSTAGSTNALIRDGATPTSTNPTTYASSDLILAGGGDNLTSPSPLGNGTWGFALASPNSTSGSGSEDVVASGFDSSYPTGDDSDPQNKFAKVPAKGSDLLIAKNAGVTTDALTRIYYGTKITSSNTSGLYKGTVTYTVIGNSSASGLASVTPSRTAQLAGGEVITIATPSTAALSSLGAITATVGGQTCSNPNAYKSSDGVSINVTCTTPALATGFHDVAVSFAGTSQSYIVAGGLEYYQDATSVASTFQDFTPADCLALNVGQNLTLQDSRDGKTYTVSKFPDNNCWMTQNLRLGDPNQTLTLTSADSDVASDFTLSQSFFQTTTTGTRWEDNLDQPHVYSFAENSAVSAADKILYGHLYNWYAATAGTGTSTVTDGAEAPSSICPKGWKLPLSDDDNASYLHLFHAADLLPADVSSAVASAASLAYVNAMQASPYSFPKAGFYKESHVNMTGAQAGYHTRVSSSSANSREFYFIDNGQFSTTHYDLKSNGLSVRCLLSP